jgi:hypothetical protein
MAFTATHFNETTATINKSKHRLMERMAIARADYFSTKGSSTVYFTAPGWL